MKLNRVRPMQRVSFCSPIAEENALEDVLLYDFHNLKSFTEAVILGKNTINYNKKLLNEYIKEVVLRNRASELLAQLDERLKCTIHTLLKNLDVLDEDSEQHIAEHGIGDLQLLATVERSWCHLRSSLGELLQLCSPLEASSRRKFTIWGTAMKYYKEQLDEKDRLYDRLITVMLDKVTEYRDGKEVVFCQLRNMVEMLSFVKYYDVFEERLLVLTGAYYRQFVSQVISQNSVFHNCILFQKRIKYEEECCSQYLLKHSVTRVMDTLKLHMLQLNADVLMNEVELKQAITSKDVKSMHVLFSLYIDTEWERKLYECIFTACQSIGADIVTKFVEKNSSSSELIPEDYTCFITQLQEFKSAMDATIKNEVSRIADYRNKEQAIWNNILNSTPELSDLVAYSLAFYAEGEPHESQMYTLDADEGNTDFIMHLFRSLTNKPYFEETFRALLSKRLLYSQEINRSHLNLVASLKDDCGAAYVSKLEALVTDYQSSSQYSVDYNKSEHCKSTAGHEESLKFSVLVVSTDSWLAKSKLARPEVDDSFTECDVEGTAVEGGTIEVTSDPKTETVLKMQEGFSEFYRCKFRNRSISYLPDFGSALIQMEFKGVAHDLKLSICQAYCLLAFNTMDTLSLDTMAHIMGKEYNEVMLRKHLGALNSGPLPLILFRYDMLNFDNCAVNEHFWLNLEFSHPDLFCDLQYKELTFEKDKCTVSKADPFEDISPSVEASIVRYMKQELEKSTTDVFRVCAEKFSSIDRFAFNKIVDSLVDRDFLSLDHKNQVLKYVP